MKVFVVKENDDRFSFEVVTHLEVVHLKFVIYRLII